LENLSINALPLQQRFTFLTDSISKLIPTFSYRAADVNPLVLALFLFLLLLFFFFPQLPTLFSMPLSPPTVLGGSAFLTLIIQK
jgi:hypothetical protein